MIRVSNQPQRRNTSKIIVLLVLILLGIWIYSHVVFDSQKYWADNSQEQDIRFGNLFSLTKFLNAELPKTPQLSLRKWSEFHDSSAAKSTRQLLFIGNASDSSQADYQELLRWVAAGNHVVLPLPSSALKSDVSQFTQNDAPSPAPAHRSGPNTSIPYTQWLSQNLAVTVQEIPDKTSYNPDDKTDKRVLPNRSSVAQNACKQSLVRLEYAQHAAKPSPNRSISINDSLDHYMWKCLNQIEEIKLPEGADLTLLNSNSNVLKPLPNAKVLWQGQGLAGSHIIRLAYGKGSVTLVSDISPFGNPEDPTQPWVSDLNRFDHAYLARYLAQDKTRLIFVRDMVPFVPRLSAPVDSAWWRLWLEQPLLMILLMVGVVLLVWRFGLRVGAVHAPSTEQTLDLTTYLHAQGQFLAHNGTLEAKLDSIQNIFFQQWQKRWPNWLQLNRQAKLALLGDYYPNAEPNDLTLWLNTIPKAVSKQDWLLYLQAHQRMTHFSGNLKDKA